MLGRIGTSHWDVAVPPATEAWDPSRRSRMGMCNVCCWLVTVCALRHGWYDLAAVARSLQTVLSPPSDTAWFVDARMNRIRFRLLGCMRALRQAYVAGDPASLRDILGLGGPRRCGRWLPDRQGVCARVSETGECTVHRTLVPERSAPVYRHVEPFSPNRRSTVFETAPTRVEPPAGAWRGASVARLLARTGPASGGPLAGRDAGQRPTVDGRTDGSGPGGDEQRTPALPTAPGTSAPVHPVSGGRTPPGPRPAWSHPTLGRGGGPSIGSRACGRAHGGRGRDPDPVRPSPPYAALPLYEKGRPARPPGLRRRRRPDGRAAPVAPLPLAVQPPDPSHTAPAGRGDPPSAPVLALLGAPALGGLRAAPRPPGARRGPAGAGTVDAPRAVGRVTGVLHAAGAGGRWAAPLPVVSQSVRPPGAWGGPPALAARRGLAPTRAAAQRKGPPPSRPHACGGGDGQGAQG